MYFLYFLIENLFLEVFFFLSSVGYLFLMIFQQEAATYKTRLTLANEENN